MMQIRVHAVQSAQTSDTEVVIVASGGHLVMMVSNAGTERILAFHGPGAIVGELAIIDGLPRTTSAVAVRDSALSFLSRAAFEAFAEKHHPPNRDVIRTTRMI